MKKSAQEQVPRQSGPEVYPRTGQPALPSPPRTYEEFTEGLDRWVIGIAPPGAYRVDSWLNGGPKAVEPSAGGTARIHSDGRATITMRGDQVQVVEDLLRGRVHPQGATPAAVFVHLHEALHATFESRTPYFSREVDGIAADHLDEGGIDYLGFRLFPDLVRFLRVQDLVKEDLVDLFYKHIDASIRQLLTAGFEHLLHTVAPQSSKHWLPIAWRWICRDFSPEPRLQLIAEDLVWARGGDYNAMYESRRQAVQIEVEHYCLDMARFYRESARVRGARLEARVNALCRAVDAIQDEVNPRRWRLTRRARHFYRRRKAPPYVRRRS